jgi:hypothetical protein
MNVRAEISVIRNEMRSVANWMGEISSLRTENAAL